VKEGEGWITSTSVVHEHEFRPVAKLPHDLLPN
jgi:hypothetical protein